VVELADKVILGGSGYLETRREPDAEKAALGGA